MALADTIYAVASGEGVSAISVLRVSGPACRDITEKMIGRALAPKMATLVYLRDSEQGQILDRCLAILFPGPASFTGEDCLELHVHGGLAVKAGVLRALGRISGCRPAQPGEFTRRAFENGKLDLNGVEALGDLLAARTERQRAQALGLFDGGLSRRAESWRGEIIAILALVEAQVDFVDEGEAPEDIVPEISKRMGLLCNDIKGIIDRSRGAEVIREGYRVAICGAPNVGKSSLLNAIADRDAAIVSNVAGTTRDVIEVSLDLSGLLVVLWDTAGVRDSSDEIERLGVARARSRAGEADLVLWLSEAGAAGEIDPEIADTAGQVLRVCTKADLDAAGKFAAGEDLRISVRTGEGLKELVERIRANAWKAAGAGEDRLLARERHFREAESALENLLEAQHGLGVLDIEVIAEHLRRGALSVGALSGAVGVEDILDEIFSRFCMGK